MLKKSTANGGKGADGTAANCFCGANGGAGAGSQANGGGFALNGGDTNGGGVAVNGGTTHLACNIGPQFFNQPGK